MPKGKYKKTDAHKKKIAEKMKHIRAGDSRKPFCFITKSGKTFREKDLDRFAEKQDSRQIKDKFAKSYGKGLKEPLYNPEVLANLLEINTYHARCCAVKATDTAGLGYVLQPIVDNPSQEAHDEIDTFFNSQVPPINVLLSRMQKDYESIGYSGLELARVGDISTGRPAKLFHMPAHTIRIHESGKKFVQKRSGFTKWFKLINYDKDIDCGTGIEGEFGAFGDKRANELIWNTDYSSRSDYYGITCAAPAIGAIYGDLGRRDYNIAFFSNFGIPAYAVFITGDFEQGEEDENGKTELEKTIEEHFSDISKNPHSTLVLTIPSARGATTDVKISIQPLAVDIKEASFRLYRKDNRDEVIVAHGVPAYRIGVTETGSLGGSIAREATEIYKRSIIEPRQTVLEQIINQEIIWHVNGFNNKDWEFKFIDIDTTDEVNEKEMINFLFTRGAITIRQIINHYADKYGLEDDEDDPMLDVRYIDGRPISGEYAYTADFKSVLKSLQNKLLEKVVKDASGNGSLKKKVDLIKLLKEMEEVK